MYNGASLPSRERGLKYYKADCHRIFICVAPLAGAWIEIVQKTVFADIFCVAPLAGAWIEILRLLG